MTGFPQGQNYINMTIAGIGRMLENNLLNGGKGCICSREYGLLSNATFVKGQQNIVSKVHTLFYILYDICFARPVHVILMTSQAIAECATMHYVTLASTWIVFNLSNVDFIVGHSSRFVVKILDM